MSDQLKQVAILYLSFFFNMKKVSWEWVRTQIKNIQISICFVKKEASVRQRPLGQLQIFLSSFKTRRSKEMLILRSVLARSNEQKTFIWFEIMCWQLSAKEPIDRYSFKTLYEDWVKWLWQPTNKRGYWSGRLAILHCRFSERHCRWI